MTSAKCSMKYDFQTMSQVLYHPKELLKTWNPTIAMSFSRNLKKHTIPSPFFEFHVVFSHEIHIPQAMASRRGLPQLGTLGAGNHYAEIQVKMEGMGLGWSPANGWLG